MAEVGQLTVKITADTRELMWRLDELHEQELRRSGQWTARQMIAAGLRHSPKQYEMKVEIGANR